MMSFFCKIFLLVFFILYTNSFSRMDDLNFLHLTINDGLSSNDVNCIIQDNQGFMWFGTVSGLNRFDGYSFVTYSTNQIDSNHISNNIILSLCEDNFGNFWIGTANGLNLFDRGAERFYSFKHDSLNPSSLPDNKVNFMMVDDDGNLWVGTDNGLAFLSDSVITNIKTNKNPKFEIYKYNPKNDESISSNNIKYIFEDQKGTIWVSVWCFGINRFYKEKKTFKRYTQDASERRTLWQTKTFKSLPGVCIETIYQNPKDEDNIIWLGSSNELIKFDTEKETFTAIYPKPENLQEKSRIYITSLIRTSNNLFLLGTSGHGLNIFDEDREIFYPIKKEPNNPNSLSSNIIRTIYEDKSGVIWLGTSGGGVSRIDTKLKKFHSNLNDNEQKNKLDNIMVTAIFEDLADGHLWIGTECSGLIKYDPITKNYTIFNIDSLEEPWEGKPACYPIVSIFQSLHNKNAIWLAIEAKGFVKYNKKQNKFRSYNMLSPKHKFYKHMKDTKDLYSTVYPSQIVGDNKKRLWVTALGLYEYNPRLNKFRVFKHDPNTSNSIAMDKLTCLHYDQNECLWIGTNGNGLDRYDLKNDQFTHYRSDPSDSTTLNSNFITCIYQDKNEILWIGTLLGINKVIPSKTDGSKQKNTIFKRYYKKDGLPDDIILGIMEDDSSNLWLSTNNGLSKYNIKNNTFRNYSISDGLPDNKFNTRSCFKNNKGELFFGGPNGFISFFPDSIKDNLNTPAIVLTDFQLFNKALRPGKTSPLNVTISEASEINLNYDQSVFSFEFAALEYSASQKNKYAFKMEGVDPDWVYTNASRRFATYTNLDPGKYVFKVKGSNNDGIWNEEGTSIRIIITPPWWHTKFAYTLYIFLFITALYGSWRLQLNRMRTLHQLEMEHLNAEKLEEVDTLKSRFFANISHEFRTPLTLILGPVKQMLSGELKGNLNDHYQIIVRNAERLLQLINQLLDLSKLDSGKLKLQAEHTEIVSYLRQLVQSFESLARHKQITLKFHAELEEQLVYLDRDKFEEIIYNLLSNAFKFIPQGGSVVIALSLRGDHRPPDNVAISHRIASLHSSARNDDNGFIQISISDSGPGIPSQYLDKIFDRFFQVNHSEKGTNEYAKDGAGSGIGLALTKELVELHHGNITLKSEVGKGSVFILAFPLGKKHLEENELKKQLSVVSKQLPVPNSNLPAEEPTPMPSQQGNAFRSPVSTSHSSLVLIVEDNADMRRFIINCLEDSYHILEAEDGSEGLTIALEEIPDIIISDVMMPKMGGMEFCMKIKSDHRTSHIPVILMTARAAQEDKIEGLETGADAYITKPFDKRELNVQVENLISLRRTLREKFRSDLNFSWPEININSLDQKFITTVVSLIEENMSDPDFSADILQTKTAMSQRQLHRKIQAISGLTPGQLIRSQRLVRAKTLLDNHTENISQIAFEVGFNNLSYFSKCFKEKFGKLPREV